jgi:hypothetical protein
VLKSDGEPAEEKGMTSFTLPNGRTVHTSVARPFFVRRNHGADGHYGSIEAARRAATPGDGIFLDYAPGCGHFIERAGESR